MAVVTTFSPSITQLDAIPAFRLPTGESSPGMARLYSDFVTALTTDSIGSVYKILRVPTNIKLKRLYVMSNVPNAGAGAADIDLAFSDNSTDGTPVGLSTGTIQATPSFGIIQINLSAPADNKLFGAAQTLVSTGAGITLFERTFAGTFTQANQNAPLWQALQTGVSATAAIDPRITLSSPNNALVGDPGGFFDLSLKVTTAMSANSVVGILIEYVE